MWGLPDLLSPQWTEPYKDGKLKVTGGDGYIAFIRFPRQGLPQIESVNMYGASSKPGNKHFDDQVRLFMSQTTKKMTLDKQEIYRNAERVYHPR
jgi:acyl-homoserine-lactone acylase